MRAPVKATCAGGVVRSGVIGGPPAAAMTAEEPRHQATADVAAAADLLTHDIDTDDLFALVTEAEPEPRPQVAQQPARPANGQLGRRRQRDGREGTQCTRARSSVPAGEARPAGLW